MFVVLQSYNSRNGERLERGVDTVFSCCCCSVPQLNTLRVTEHVHPYPYTYRYRYTEYRYTEYR